MTRILTPVRETKTGIFFHHCPLNDEKITDVPCKTCQFKKEIIYKPTKYIVHCNVKNINEVTLTEYEPPKAHDEYKGLSGFDVINSTAHTLIEPKLDGARAIVHCTPYGVFVTSRRRNKEGNYNQFQDNIPHIKEHKGLLALGKWGETILDGEIIMPGDGDSLGKTMSIVGSLPEKAIELQKSTVSAQLHLFDISMYRGEYVSDLTLQKRKELLEEIRNIYFDNDINIKLVPVKITKTIEERKRILSDFLSSGLEGAVIKDPSSKYFESRAWLKVKTKVTVDAIVTGWDYGKIGGKFEKTIGALKVSVIDKATNSLREISQVIPGDDILREELYQRLSTLSKEEILNQKIIVEMEAQIWSIDYRLRHPRILRYRKDRSEPNIIDFEKVQRV